MKTYEADEQEALFQWAEVYANIYPELQLMFHIPNGGSRNRLEAANLKRQGVKAGVPDILLPSPRGKYHGLFIELKVAKNKPTVNQINWLQQLSKQGYAVCICYSWTEAREKIIKYLEVKSEN